MNCNTTHYRANSSSVPGDPTATTTFLAVALGSGLFALNYRATLDAQTDRSAAFAVGAKWRTTAAPTIAPLTRFRAPTPAMRFRVDVALGAQQERSVGGTLVGLPATALPAVEGWRDRFSPLTREEIAARLRTGSRLTGPRVAGVLRLWVRCDVPARLVLELFAPGQRFLRVVAGDIGPQWRRVQVRVPRSLLAGITVSSPLGAFSASLHLGPLQQRIAGRWRTLDTFNSWLASTPQPGVTMPPIPEGLRGAPLRRARRFPLGERGVPFIRPGYRVPLELPALVSDDLAARAVDGRLRLNVEGYALPIRAVARSAFFPTVTDRPTSFAVADYDTLFAVLNAYRPGLGVPHEAWFFGGAKPGAGTVISRAESEAAARRDSLATATSTVLALAAVLAVLLSAAGLALAAAATLRGEAGEFSAWLALGAAPATLAASLRTRVLLVAAAGGAAAVLGGALAVRLIAALVAVNAAGTTPLPPIEPYIAWPASAALIALSALAGAVVARRLGRAILVRARTRRIRA